MNEVCTLTNNSTGRVVYKITDPDYNVRREIFPNQSVRGIKVLELEKLLQQPGGAVLFYNYLHIDDEEILDYLRNGKKVAPEYYLTAEQLPSWMAKSTLEEFKDALDFAPEGVKDQIKKLAVTLPLNDYAKRQAIKDQLGFDVSKALEMIKDDEEETKEKEPEKVVAPGARRSSATSIVKPAKKD